jgi:hypothetical protein
MAPFEQDYTDGNESLTISRRAALAFLGAGAAITAAESALVPSSS